MYIVIRLKRVIAAAVLILAVLCFLLSATKLPAVTAFSEQPEIPIIMYHHVLKNPGLWGEYVVSYDELEGDLQYIKELGYETVLVSDLIAYHENGTPLPEKPIVLTFDDGQESFYTYVYPLLQKYEMCAVVSIVGEYIQRFSDIEDHNLNYSMLTWDEVKELSDSGIVEIGNHTYSMHDSNGARRGSMKISNESLESYTQTLSEDIGLLQRRIEEVTGKTPQTFTYPFGFISPESVDILKAMGFKATLSCVEKLNSPSEEDWLFNLGRYNRPHGVDRNKFFIKKIGMS